MGEAWNYVRMSTEDQEDSPLTQGQHTGEFMERSQLLWTRTYFDLGISGGELAKRPGMVALLTDAERFRPACIVFYKLDRAFRNAEEQAVALRRLKKLGITTLKVRDPNIDGPQGQLIDHILGAVNQFERELTGTRIRDHNLAMAQRGEWPGGPAPFGYLYRKSARSTEDRKAVTGRLEPHPEEWPVARRIWEWALAGHRLAQILTMAHDAGYHRRGGKTFVFATLYRMFDSRIYAGYVPFGHYSGLPGGGTKRRPDRGEWYLGRQTPMITLQEWHKVQLLLRQGNTDQRSRRNPRMELAGLIRCRICGRPVASSGALKNGGYMYTCIAAARREVDHPYWSRQDWIIHTALLRVLDEVTCILPAAPPPNDTTARHEQIEQSIRRAQREMRRLRDLYRLGEYNDDMETYQADKLRIEARIAGLDAERRNLGASSDELLQRHQDLQCWHAAYESAPDVVTRQRLWRQLVEHVEVDATRLRVWLRDLGPGIETVWDVVLPPRGTRRPGVRHRTGIVGQPLDGRRRGYLAKMDTRPRPVSPVPS